MSGGLTLSKIKALDNQLLPSPFGNQKHLYLIEKLALPRSTTWRFSLGSIAFFRCLYDHQRQESHNQPRPYKYPVLIRNLFAALYTVTAAYRGFFIKSYALTRLIFHRSSMSTMRSSFEFKDERAPCKKTRLRMIFCSDAPPSTPFSPPKVPSQYVGRGWIRTNDYVNNTFILTHLNARAVGRTPCSFNDVWRYDWSYRHILDTTEIMGKA